MPSHVRSLYWRRRSGDLCTDDELLEQTEPEQLALEDLLREIRGPRRDGRPLAPRLPCEVRP